MNNISACCAGAGQWLRDSWASAVEALPSFRRNAVEEAQALGPEGVPFICTTVLRAIPLSQFTTADETRAPESLPLVPQEPEQNNASALSRAENVFWTRIERNGNPRYRQEEEKSSNLERISWRLPHCTPQLRLDLMTSGSGIVNWMQGDGKQRMEECTWLDLSHLNLNSIPAELSPEVFPKLIVLNLAGNQLTELPDTISQFQSIEQLDLGKNHLTQLPRSLFNLSSRCIVRVVNNPLNPVLFRSFLNALGHFRNTHPGQGPRIAYQPQQIEIVVPEAWDTRLERVAPPARGANGIGG